MSKPVVLRTVGGLYAGVGAAGALFSAYMSANAWKVDAGRCGVLPDEHYPELFWGLMSLPATLLLAVSGALLIASARAKRRPLTVGALAVAGVATLAAFVLAPWWGAMSACPS